MNEIMNVLYNNFYNRPPAAQLRDEIEHCHQELIERLDKPYRRLVLQIIDCKDQIAEELSMESFSAGFRLAWKLSQEANMYDCEHPILTSEVPLIETIHAAEI